MKWIHRGNLRTLLIIVGLVFMHYKAEFFNVGMGFFFTGLLLHFISKGFLRRNTALATHGPYSFFRHPFYIANFLIDIGIISMLGYPLFILIYPFLYYLSYHKVILSEEANLKQIYGDLYTTYCKQVPRYLPSLIPFAKNWHHGFKWQNLIVEREISRLLRLISYPISFFIFHELIKHQLHQPKLIQLFFGIGSIIFMILSSYLFYNIIERDRIFQNVSSKVINALFCTHLALLGFFLSFLTIAETESPFMINSSTVFLCLTGAFLVFSKKEGVRLVGDCAFLVSLSVFSELFWMIPFALLAMLIVFAFKFKIKFKTPFKFIPLKYRLLSYTLIFIFLGFKEIFD